MTVNQVIQNLQTSLMRAGHVLLLPADKDFASTLTLGQIIKGKVLRHFEGNRYEVSFNGHEKVVDSSVPLKTNEILYGRVVAVDDKIQLQRVFSDTTQGGVANTKNLSMPQYARGSNEQIANQVLDSYLANFKPAQKALIMQLVKTSKQPVNTALAALVLNKSGIPLDPLLIRSLVRAISEEAVPTRSKVDSAIPVLTSDIKINAENNIEVSAQLAAIINQQAESKKDTVADALQKDEIDEGVQRQPAFHQSESTGNNAFPEKEDRNLFEWMLGRLLLNTQTDSPVNHRLLSLPIWFGEELIEVNASFFSQNKNSLIDDGIRYQKILLSISTENLGDIEIGVYLADRNIRLEVVSAKLKTTEILGNYLSTLKNSLSDSNWIVDEISYTTAEQDQMGNVVYSVVEHHITKDSLSRLI